MNTFLTLISSTGRLCLGHLTLLLVRCDFESDKVDNRQVKSLVTPQEAEQKALPHLHFKGAAAARSQSTLTPHHCTPRLRGVCSGRNRTSHHRGRVGTGTLHFKRGVAPHFKGRYPDIRKVQRLARATILEPETKLEDTLYPEGPKDS